MKESGKLDKKKKLKIKKGKLYIRTLPSVKTGTVTKAKVKTGTVTKAKYPAKKNLRELERASSAIEGKAIEAQLNEGKKWNEPKRKYRMYRDVNTIVGEKPTRKRKRVDNSSRKLRLKKR